MDGQTNTEQTKIDIKRVDPRQVKDPRDLVDELSEHNRRLDWQLTARERQVTALELEADLTLSAAEIFARKLAMNNAEKPKAPEDAKAAQGLLGRILAKCEDAVETAMYEGRYDKEIGVRRFAQVCRLASSAAQLAVAMDRLGHPPTEHKVKVEHGRAPGRKS